MPLTSEGVTRVIILRHGASTFNVEGRYQGCCDDSVLTEEGRAAALLSGERLYSEGIAALISSPLQRAVETARAVLAIFQQSGLRIPIETDVRLREVELGAWECMAYDKVKKRFPDQFQAWSLHPSNLRMALPSGEDTYPVRNLYSRVNSFWKDLLLRDSGKSVLLITHGGTARAMITSAMGFGIDHFQRFQQSNCGMSCLSVSADSGRAKLDLLNDTTHLRKSLPKLKEGRTGVRLILIAGDSERPADYVDLFHILARVPIDDKFILGLARPATQAVLGGGTEAQQISENELERWLEQVLKTANGAPVSQAAVVAPSDFVRPFLERHLDMTRVQGDFLKVSGSGITVIHWPCNGMPPVLQGMNLFGNKNHLTGGQE